MSRGVFICLLFSCYFLSIRYRTVGIFHVIVVQSYLVMWLEFSKKLVQHMSKEHPFFINLR